MTTLLLTFLFLGLLIAHWYVSLFFQTAFHHRYCTHGQFTMSKRWERAFHVMAYLAQGSSYLLTRAYVIMHRMHHAYSDEENDPHSPKGFTRDFWSLLKFTWGMSEKFAYIKRSEAKLALDPEKKHFLQNLAPITRFDRWADSWYSRLLFGVLYALPYYFFADMWWQWILLPIHFVMAPIQGTIVNWFGHKVGYVNFDNGDLSTNTSKRDFFLMGELLQNNHHRHPARPNFAVKNDEYDPTYSIFLRMLERLKIITFTLPQ